MLVLSDESLIDLSCDEHGKHLLLRAELGMVKPDEILVQVSTRL